jgi:hypothetical protein
MPELFQIVATNLQGECPVALAPPMEKRAVLDQLADFRDHGHGSRKTSRPLLEVRDQSGNVVELSEGKPSEPSKKK